MDWVSVWTYTWEAIRTHPFDVITLSFGLIAILTSIIALYRSHKNSRVAQKSVDEAQRIREANERAIDLRAKELEGDAVNTKFLLDVAKRNALSSEKSAATAEESVRATVGAVEVLKKLALENFKMRVDSFRPVTVFEVTGSRTFSIRNIGNGPALDVELRFAQLKEDGHLINLRNFFEKAKEQHLMNIGSGRSVPANGGETVYDYLRADKPDFRSGVQNLLAILATYMDINGNPYYTLALFESVEQKGERVAILRRTKTGSYDSGEIELLSVRDWMARWPSK
jgi:hypothetical protein